MHGQWLNYPTPGTPRTKDGKPNLSAPAPRAANSKPDLSGLWVVEATPLADLPTQGASTIAFEGATATPIRNRYLFNILADFKPEDSPMLPAAQEIYRQRRLKESADLPSSHCLPSGIPLSMTLPYPFKFVQTPEVLIVLHEGDSAVRQIYTDGRKHTADPQPTYMGWGTPLEPGMETRWLWIRWDSMTTGGWTTGAVRAVMPCIRWNASPAGISGT